jgi:hypothetical protein
MLPVTTGTFTSAARLGVLSLPVFWGAAALIRRGWLDGVGRGLSLLALGLGVFSLPVHQP